MLCYTLFTLIMVSSDLVSGIIAAAGGNTAVPQLVLHRDLRLGTFDRQVSQQMAHVDQQS